jgi:hypothetical protein
MAGFTVDFPQQIAAGAPGVSMTGSNTKVKGLTGPLGTALDVLSFSNGGVGQWTVPNQKTRTLGVFIVSQSSQGMATVPTPGGPVTVPVLVVTGDARIKSL